MAQDVTEARRPGRPREFDQTVSIRLPSTIHDDLSREALRRGVDMSEVIRQRLARRFVSQNSPER